MLLYIRTPWGALKNTDAWAPLPESLVSLDWVRSGHLGFFKSSLGISNVQLKMRTAVVGKMTFAFLEPWLKTILYCLFNMMDTMEEFLIFAFLQGKTKKYQQYVKGNILNCGYLRT